VGCGQVHQGKGAGKLENRALYALYGSR
jgi:hypothetical protein